LSETWAAEPLAGTSLSSIQDNGNSLNWFEGVRTMMAKPVVLAAVILLSVPAACLAQSQSGSNFGVPYSGAAISRSNGGGYAHARHRDSSDQNAHSSSGGGGQETDARDAGTAPVARQASTPK
jgi:hypothetical protein